MLDKKKGFLYAICLIGDYLLGHLFTGMRMVSHSQSGKICQLSPDWSQTDIYNTYETLISQYINRKQPVYAYYVVNIQLNNVKTKFHPR